MATFTERLRELRTQSDYSQQDLADKMGVTKQTISQYERGVRKPDMDTLTALCDIFNVSSDYLMGKSDVTVRLLNSDDLKRLNMSYQKQSDLAVHFDEHKLLKNYRKLNDTGKAKAQEDVEDLTQIPKYTADITLIQAAHKRTDVDMPEGVDASDDTYFD